MGKERKVYEYVKEGELLKDSLKEDRKELVKEVGGSLLALGGLILNHWLNKKKK